MYRLCLHRHISKVGTRPQLIQQELRLPSFRDAMNFPRVFVKGTPLAAIEKEQLSLVFLYRRSVTR